MIRTWRARVFVAFTLGCTLLLAACAGQRSTPKSDSGGSAVTIYVSTDRVFSEPILKAYEQKSGVKVNAIYDTEETKSTSLANRLLAEKNNPQADVFCSNEPVRTLAVNNRKVLGPGLSGS